MSTPDSFMKSVFFGAIAEGLVFPYPELPASEVDQLHMVLGSVRKFFAANVDSKTIDREHVIPDAVLAGPQGARPLRHARPPEPSAASACRRPPTPA